MFNKPTFLKKHSKLLIILLLIILITAIGFGILFFYSTSVTKNIDLYNYSLPFKKGDSHLVVQGYGGLFSHKNTAAIDFEMPVGTTIHAARGGTIYSFKDDSDEGGPFAKYNKKANYLIIKHNDGSFGCYWHLQKNGVLIKNGLVAEGQQIGISGATGFVLKPHLHFSVKVKLNYSKDAFIQTKFKTSQGLQILKRGEAYESTKE